MAKSDLLVSLVRAGISGDKNMLRSTTEAVIADERKKGHHLMADRIQRVLEAPVISAPSYASSQPAQGGGKDIIYELTPTACLESLVLTDTVISESNQLIEEHMRADVLRSHGYEPRHRVLLSGPPGNGKTSYAESIAEALSLPFFVVRYDALVGSYLGETNTRLRKLFDYAKTQPCVLFFDEFDSIGKERGDTHETGEIKRIVSFLLMQIDQLPSYVLTIAATNHAELLDRAVWRRFQLRMNFPAPSMVEVSAFIQRIMDSWPEKPKASAVTIAKQLNAPSYAEAGDFCQNVRRRHILGMGEVGIDSLIKIELNLWKSRVTMREQDANRSNQAALSAKRKSTATARSRNTAKSSKT